MQGHDAPPAADSPGIVGADPPHVRAGVELIIEEQVQRSAALEAQAVSLQKQVRVLRERLSQNSQNSSKPPSSDGPHVKRPPPKEPSGRKPGGQPGHPGHRRTLIPVEQVKAVVACLPTHCRRCGQPVQGVDREPLRHQVVEVPPIIPQVTAYQLQRLHCPRCGSTTCGHLPPGDRLKSQSIAQHTAAQRMPGGNLPRKAEGEGSRGQQSESRVSRLTARWRRDVR